MDLRISSLLILAGVAVVWCDVTPIGCLSPSWSMTCLDNGDSVMWVDISDLSPSPCGDIEPCSEEKREALKNVLISRCAGSSSCTLFLEDLGGQCSAKVNFQCVQGKRTTPRVPDLTQKPEDNWHQKYDSWQWAIIWIVIGVVAVALIILIIMLINRCCFKTFNQEKPKFVEATPTPSNMGSNLNSRSVSMSTLHRPPPVKKEVSQEEIDEVRAHFGTARKQKDKDKYFGQGVGSLDSQGSSGDGDANGKYFTGDDSSSGIGSSTYESRLKNPLYDVTDTCHDDYLSFTMKKQAKSPLVNPNAYNTMGNAKKVDEDMYKEEAPTVDIHEDKREEDFRIDINSWDINVHQRPQQRQKKPAEQQPPTEQPKPPQSEVQQPSTVAPQSNPEPEQSDEHNIINEKCNGHNKMNGNKPVANGDMPVANGDVPIANGDVPIANGDVPIANGDAHIEEGLTDDIDYECSSRL